MFSVARCFTGKKLGGISRFMFTVHNPLVSTVRNGASRDSMNLQACTRTYRIVQTRAGYLTRLYPTMLIARRRRHGQGPLLPPLPVFSHEYNNGPRPRIHVPRNLSGAACLPACLPTTTDQIQQLSGVRAADPGDGQGKWMYVYPYSIVRVLGIVSLVACGMRAEAEGQPMQSSCSPLHEANYTSAWVLTCSVPVTRSGTNVSG